MIKKILLLMLISSTGYSQGMRLFQMNSDASGTCQLWNQAQNIKTGQLFYCRSTPPTTAWTPFGSGTAANPGGNPNEIQVNIGGVSFGGIPATGTGNIVKTISPTITSPTIVTPNITGGFVISGGATTKFVPRGNGTSFVAAQLSCGDLSDSGSGCSGSGGGSTPGGNPGDIQINVSGTSLGGVASSGTGNVVRVTSPALITPNLGTPSAVVLTNGLGLPIGTGVTGLGTNVSTLLSTNNAGGLYTTNGIVKGNGAGLFSLSTLGTDYAAPLTPTTTANPASVTPDCISNNYIIVTALAQTYTINNPTNCTSFINLITFAIKDAGSAQTLSFGGNYRGISTPIPSATVAGKQMYISGKWNVAATKFDILGVGVESADTNYALTDISNTFSGLQTFAATRNTETSDVDGATITFNIGNGGSNLHRVTLGGARTLAISNGGVGAIFTITLCQDSMGGRTVTWFTTIKWSGGTVPTLTSTANKCDKFTFEEFSSGNFDGTIAGLNF